MFAHPFIHAHVINLQTMEHARNKDEHVADVDIAVYFVIKDPPRGSHLGFVHTFLVIFNGVSRRNILINFIEILHTVRKYYSKVRNRATFVI